MLHTLKITALYQARQPIVHTEDTIGNISKIKKLRVIHDGKPVAIPALSGNSFRGQLRDILADQMFALITENGTQRIKLSPNEYGVVYSGGLMNKKVKMGDQMKNFANAIPMLRLLGSAFGNVMLPSKLAATHIIPFAVETQTILQQSVQELADNVRNLLPTEPPQRNDLLFNDGPLTRKDDTKDLSKQRFAETVADLSEDEEKTKTQMIYEVECIPLGAFLLQDLYTKYPLDELELGCLFDGLQAFFRSPSLGGRSAAGYGQVRALYCVQIHGQNPFEFDSDQLNTPEMITSAIKSYRDYITNKKDTILKVLKAESL